MIFLKNQELISLMYIHVMISKYQNMAIPILKHEYLIMHDKEIEICESL